MREIKFRAWDGNRMWEPDIMSHGVAYEDWRDWEDGSPYSKNIMQYTGLKDKNGVEIYEGDVFINERHVDIDGDEPINSYYNGRAQTRFPVAFTITWNERLCQFHGRGNRTIMGKVATHPLLHNDQIEVIGNIYENPELWTP